MCGKCSTIRAPLDFTVGWLRHNTYNSLMSTGRLASPQCVICVRSEVCLWILLGSNHGTKKHNRLCIVYASHVQTMSVFVVGGVGFAEGTSIEIIVFPIGK